MATTLYFREFRNSTIKLIRVAFFLDKNYLVEPYQFYNLEVSPLLLLLVETTFNLLTVYIF